MGVAFLFVTGAALGIDGSSAIAAEAPPLLWGKEPVVCPFGSGAGQCDFPRGVAAYRGDGHVFVADQINARIDEFNALGRFIKTWGWDVVASGPDNSGTGFEICVPEKGDACEAGSLGSGAGQFSELVLGVALDSAGNVYVTDRGFFPSPKLRVQKFSPGGQFELMFGGEVNKTKTEEVGSSEAERNICPVDPGDECKAGTVGTGNGQFGEWGIGDFIAIDDRGTATLSDDKVYVGDQNRIQVFDTEGQYKESLPLPGVTVQSLATDTAGSLYAIYAGGADVRKLTPAGEELAEPRFEVAGPTAVTVDAAGDVFAFAGSSIHEFDSGGKETANFGGGEFTASTGLATNLCAGSESPGNLYATNLSESDAFLRAYGTDPIGCFKVRTGKAEPIEEEAATLNGTVDPDGLAVSECFFEYGKTTAYGQTANCEAPAAGEITGSDPVEVHAAVGSLEAGTVYHFRLIAKIGGETETGDDEEFKTFGPPTISGEHTVSAAYTEATLKALVNPEGLATTYRFQYTTQADFEEHGFAGAKSTAEIGIGKARGEHPVLANLEGLAPGTAYRWRVLASNASGASESKEANAFVTYRTFLADTSCPNQSFRRAAAALLPDCRAYEMVSPVDKNGGDIFGGLNGVADPGLYVQASPDGGRIAYGVAFASFAGQPVSSNLNEYLAQRGEEGWSSEGIHPPVSGHPGPSINRDFMAFSADLCGAWLVSETQTPLVPDGQEGLPNLYRRQNCGAGTGGLEALTSSPPALPSGTSDQYVSEDSVEGLSADAGHVLFVAGAKLTSEEGAEGTENKQIYDRFEGENHLVSVLPGGAADASGAEVGSGNGGGRGNLDNAVSGDGERVYWTSEIEVGIGRIYLREHPEQGTVAGECSEATLACTLKVSAGPNAFYWTASEDGSKALYSEHQSSAGEDLFEFDLEKEEENEDPRRLIAHRVLGVAGGSDDLARIYFVSTDALNGEAEGEEGGQPNLYLAEGETFQFIATLSAGDVGKKEPGAESSAYNVVSPQPYERATRVSADGGRIAFESRAPLTGFDNADAAGGKPSVEVYSYEAGGALVCVSCSPSGAAPKGGREMSPPYVPPFSAFPNATRVTAAAWIPTWEHRLHASNVLSADGQRLFFNSNDALVPRDANGAQDVYEWEAPGAGECSTASPSFFPQNGGCLFLISSGESSYESEFWEADPGGSNVFFTTEASLLPQDPGSVDLYDARVDGGFPQPVARAECEGEACQSPPPPPAFATPSSGSYNGPPNPAPGKPRCPKGKRQVRRKGKIHCAKKKAKAKGRKARQANRKRSAAR